MAITSAGLISGIDVDNILAQVQELCAKAYSDTPDTADRISKPNQRRASAQFQALNLCSRCHIGQ